MKNLQKLKFSIAIPTYNMGHTIRETLASVLNQSYSNFEVIIQDNDSNDNTFEVIKSFSDPRIKYFKNDNNLGYSRNLIQAKKNCTGDIIYFLGADDILSKNALSETCQAFLRDDSVGAVTRPYFWFQEDINVPIRITPRLNDRKDELVYIQDNEKAIQVMHNEILGQLSGLAFRMKYLEESFFTKENDWIAHGYPFLHVFKKHPVVYLKNYQVAVRIGANNIRQKGSSLYNASPTKRWIEMLDEIFHEEEFQKFKLLFIKQIISANYLGLIQIKCYSRIKFLIREIYYLVKYRWSNLLVLKFWFFSLGCLIIPSSILIKIVDYYKNKINNKLLKTVDFEYSL